VLAWPFFRSRLRRAPLALCTVGRTGNDPHCRGYDILGFTDTAEFEEIAYLLVHEALPTPAQLAA
jgi:2-methylcitrate synthase